MAINFSRIINQAAQVSNAVASVGAITKAAQTSATALNSAARASGNISKAANDIRIAVGADLNVAEKDLLKVSKSFQQRGELDIFNPKKLDSLVSNPAQLGNVAAAAGTIANAIQGISGRGGVNVNNGLTSGLSKVSNTLGSIAGVASTLSRVSSQFNSSVGSIKSKLSSLNGFNINSLNSLVGSFGDFTNLVQNVVTVIPRDVGELIGAVGGEFDRLRQLAEQGDLSGISGDFLDLTFKNPWNEELVRNASGGGTVSAGTAKSRIPNPLREAISWNYVITLGILNDSEFNFPSQYRETDFTQSYILKSGGGNLGKRYKTYLEGNEDAEYYIENLEMDAVIAPNRATNVALGTTLTFEVVEPYSMGQFIEAVIGASSEIGYANYTDAPFCLRIDFVGWDEYGESAGTFTQPIYIPILITKINFSVTGKGAMYEVKAVPMSETGLDDKIQESNVQIQAAGQKVHEILNGDEKSVQSVYNERVQELEQAGTTIQEDRYIIAFPKTADALVNVVKEAGGQLAGSTSLTVDAPEQQRREKGIANPEIDRSTEKKQAGIESNSVQAPSNLFTVLKAYASDTGSMNPIGLSDLVIDTNAPGDTPQAEQSSTYDEFGDVVDLGSAEAAAAEKGRIFRFRQGETITDIITKVLLDSEYCKEKSTEESTNGTKQWFKIDTQVFIDRNPGAELQRGRSPKIYVYSVLPYFTDEAKFLAPTQSPANTEGLKALAPKEYNYFYTGHNEDVLNFDIAFNNAFFQAAFANYGQNSGTVALDGANKKTLQNSNEVKGSEIVVEGGVPKREPGAQFKETNEMRYTAASVSGDMRQRIAEQFHNTLINSPADMVTAEMEIWGDPFFLPQQTGNFTGTPTSNPNILAEQTMNYLQNEVFCVVNFKTPFDYQVQGATMEFPQNVPQFSGLYSIWAVTNTFSRGQFRQTLKMIRRRGQDDTPTTSNVPIRPSDDKNIKETTDRTLGANGEGAGANNSVNSTAGASNPCDITSPVNAVQAVQNITQASAEDLLMSMPVFNNKSTTAGDDIVFSQPVIQIGEFAWTPNQNIFASAPKAAKQAAAAVTQATSAVQQIEKTLQQANIVAKARPSGPGGNGGV